MASQGPTRSNGQVRPVARAIRLAHEAPCIGVARLLAHGASSIGLPGIGAPLGLQKRAWQCMGAQCAHKEAGIGTTQG